MSNTGNIDYEALAKQYGATSSEPKTGAVDYEALAKQNGAISSTTYHGVVSQAQLDQIKALNASPTQFEYERNPENQAGWKGGVADAASGIVKGLGKQVAIAGSGPVGAAYQVYEEGKKAVADISDLRATGKTDAMRADDQRKEQGRSLAYRAVAPLGGAVGLDVPAMEHAADIGDAGAIAGQAAVPAVVAASPIIADGLVKKLAPAVEKFSSSAVDKFQGTGVQKAVIPEASGLPPKAISGAEDIFRAAAPTGKNAGFRENVMVAAPDIADVARKVNIEEAKGGIINPDMRVRATVDALDSHLDQMYKTERAPQIQAHAEVPVKVGMNEDSVRGLEYLENTAGTADIRNLAEKALGQVGENGKRMAPQPLTLAETDTLAQAANKYLKNYERAPGDVQMQMQQTSPKVGGLKALDSELGRSINDVLTSNGETGIRDYERRFAAVSEVRNQLRDRMNAVELERQSLGKYVKVVTGGKEGIASASQAAVSSVNIGRRLQTAFQKLRESGITAKK